MRIILVILVLFFAINAYAADNITFPAMGHTPMEMKTILAARGFNVELSPEKVTSDTFGILYCEGSNYRLFTFQPVTPEILTELARITHENSSINDNK